MIATILQILVGAVTGIVAVSTMLPMTRSHRWWIRACDFPRAQIAIVAGATLVPAVYLAVAGPGYLGWVITVILIACLVYQCWRIAPYTPFVSMEMGRVDRTDDGSQVTILSSNVEMGNNRFVKVADLIDDVDPDILFLMETDARWHEALTGVLARYETVVTELRDNCYGMIFATRLRADKARIVYLTPDDTPSLFAELHAPAGKVFRFVGLHPRPPVPGNTTHERDGEILFAARFAHKSDIPVISMGDFNDAAWSDTSRRFKTVGGYLDPRIGRGMVPSFHTNSHVLRTPIDQFYATPDIALCDFARGPHIGSDHFPIIARIDLDADKARAHNTAPADVKPKDRDRLSSIFERHAQRLGARARTD